MKKSNNIKTHTSYFDYLIYFETALSQYRIFDNVTKKIYTVDKLPNDRHMFFIFKGYEATDEGLVKFNEDFKKWDYELRFDKSYRIEYTTFFNHFGAVECKFVNLLDKDIKKKIDANSSQPITSMERNWYDSCNNGGLIYCNAGTYDCYGYDFSSFYPTLMNDEDLNIPMTQGKEIFLKKLPKKRNDIKLGIYRVKIECDDENFEKIFNFSKKDTYTNYSLYQAYKYKKRFGVKINLIVDDEPNALIYDEYITSKEIFGNWYDTLFKLKQKYPKNKLVKYLLSTLWGTLSRSSTIYKTLQQINDEKLDVGIDDDCEWMIVNYTDNGKNEFYELVSNIRPYKWNLRMKTFLVSYGRNKASELVMNDIDNVVRVMCDGVVFNKEQDISKFEKLSAEEKTTGRIEFKNVMKYEKV
jgi:hypothetical protein